MEKVDFNGTQLPIFEFELNNYTCLINNVSHDPWM